MKNVIIVDDNNAQLMLLELLLNQIGIKPISFLDPLQALDYIKNNRVDILVSDYKMPGMNGLELVFEAKYYAPNIRTAIVSSMLDDDGELSLACKKFDTPLLARPFDALAFQGLMESVLVKKFEKIHCIRNENTSCILRDKVATRYCMSCCKDDMAEEKDIIQSALDVLDDFFPSEIMLDSVSNRLSYLANTVNTGNNSDLKELFIIIKQFSLILHEYKEKILIDNDLMSLVMSYFNVIGEWLENTFFEEDSSEKSDNYYASIKADFQAIEMILGISVVVEEDYGDLDDLFF